MKPQNGAHLDDVSRLQPPDWLGQWGRKYWLHAVDYIDGDVLLEQDSALLETYADAWQRFHESRLIVEREGLLVTSCKGGKYQHPAVGIMNQASERIRKLGEMFGLAPSARKPKGRGKARQENPIESMLREHLGRG